MLEKASRIQTRRIARQVNEVNSALSGLNDLDRTLRDLDETVWGLEQTLGRVVGVRRADRLTAVRQGVDASEDHHNCCRERSCNHQPPHRLVL
ncbi:hypothetical protein LTR16_006270, partial [Cryomyces antarcticus]